VFQGNPPNYLHGSESSGEIEFGESAKDPAEEVPEDTGSDGGSSGGGTGGRDATQGLEDLIIHELDLEHDDIEVDKPVNWRRFIEVENPNSVDYDDAELEALFPGESEGIEVLDITDDPDESGEAETLIIRGVALEHNSNFVYSRAVIGVIEISITSRVSLNFLY